MRLKAILAGGFVLMIAVLITFVTYQSLNAAEEGLAEGTSSPEEESESGSPGEEEAEVALVDDPTESVDDQDVGTWVIVALVVMSLATVVAVLVSFYLYRWRRILLENPHMLVPEEMGKYLKQLGRRIEEMTDLTARDMITVKSSISENSAAVKNMVETYMTLQNALDEREAEIRRLKKGYDKEVFRKFLSRFIRVHEAVGASIRDDSAGLKGLEQAKMLLEDAFAECGVEAFQPTVGEDYRKLEGVEAPKTVVAERAEDAFKIAEVIGQGYRIRSDEQNEVLVPAKVKVFVTEGQGGD